LNVRAAVGRKKALEEVRARLVLLVMWYVSGNRDEEMFENADDFVIERRNARNHIAFGFGIHRCLGLRLAELQLRIVWEEIVQRFEAINVVD
jgi:cytochrome P450